MNVRKNIDYSQMYKAIDEVMVQQLPQMQLYTAIGKIACSRSEKGAAVIASEYVRVCYPNVQGFSPRNLRRMRDFYRTYEKYPVLLPLAIELGWTQNVVIMEADLSMEYREWYLKATQQFGWSKAELIAQIAAEAHLKITLDDTLEDENTTECNSPGSFDPGDARLVAQADTDVVDGSRNAAVIGTFCHADELTVILIQRGEGIPNTLAVLGIIPLHVVFVGIRDLGEFLPAAFQIAHQEQEGKAVGIVVDQQLVKMLVPFGLVRGAADIQSLIDGPGSIGFQPNVHIQLTGPPSAGANTTAALVGYTIVSGAEEISDTVIANIFLGTIFVVGKIPEELLALHGGTGQVYIPEQLFLCRICYGGGLVQNVLDIQRLHLLHGENGALVVFQGRGQKIIAEFLPGAASFVDNDVHGRRKTHIPVDLI